MKDMTKGSPLGLILRFAFPLLLGNLLQQFYNLADAAIVGRYLGANALAAVGATGSVQFMILGFCIGTCTGFCVPVTQRFGAHDEGEMRRLFYNAILLTCLFAAVLTVLCILSRTAILHLLSVPENILADTHIYILIIFIGIPFTLLYNLSAGILRSVGDSRSPFLVLVVSTVTNILLDIFCVVVLKWGCAGAALATITSQALSGGLCTLVIVKKYKILHIRAGERNASGRRMRQLLLIGVPMGLQFSITGIGGMVLQSATNALGSVYASAHTVAARINMFAMCPFDALCSGTATFCSQNYGAGDYGRIRSGVRISTLTAVVYALTAGTLLVLFGRSVCLIFLSADEVQILDAAHMILRRCGYFYWVLAVLDVSRVTMQALGHSASSMISGIMEMFARAGVVLLFAPKYGFNAISFADPVAWIAADLYMIPVWLRLLGKVKRELMRDEASDGTNCRRDKSF